MNNIIQIFKQLEDNNSSIFKEGLLNKNKENQLLKDILYFVYNPYILTGISDKKINKKVEIIEENKISKINNIYEMFDYLAINNSGRDIDIYNLSIFYNGYDLEIKNFIKDIITKSLKVGITSKTINKVFGENFIPTFEIMLAKKYEEHSHKLIDKEFIITPKLDGMRIVYIKGKFLTRKGQEVEGLNNIISEMSRLPQEYVYDGEILATNSEKLKSKDLYRKTIKLSRTDGVKVGLEFHIFDKVKYEEFRKGKSTQNCFNRKNELDIIINTGNFKFIKNVPMLYVGNDITEIQKLLNKAIENDEEGVMVQAYNSLYECKRTDAILKVKQMRDCDLEVVGFEEGSGKYKNNLGRINVRYKNNIVGVGSGFSDNMRTEVWNNTQKYINKIAKIQYFEETNNQDNDKISLRFPVFLEWRFDKNTESLN